MKKYNTPELELLTLKSADVITASAFKVVATGNGVDWDWSGGSTVSIESGFIA